VALLCIDLDRFKEVNDLFGHAAGDTLLQSVARCTSSVLKEDQMLARLGGDEFAVIAPGLSDPAAAGRIAESIIDTFRAENEGAHNGGLISGSIGIAIYPNDAAERETLMSHADTALYRAKIEGRGIYRFFEAAMGAEVKERRHVEHDLLHAISRGELRLVYQPQTRLKTGEICGFEALLRWQHAERGAISPDVFIPIAEESGLILQIGEWVLRTACREAATWDGGLVVAVNVSTVQLHSTQFARLVHEVLLQTGLEPRRLELEITETALVRDKNRALATLRQLKNLGVRIAMDDFGTGYSSLSNLRAFPFDKIKIDGSFIHSVDSNGEAATIVRAVLGLGRGLGLPVLAEGVETAGELAFLTAELCAEAQGYFLGRPGAIETYQDLIAGFPRATVVASAPMRLTA
jgi:diguanylate cyclase (GGDEF)-like protein